MKTMSENRLLSTTEAAEMCRVSTPTVMDACTNGRLKSQKVGGQYVILLNDLYEHCGTNDPGSYISTIEIIDLLKIQTTPRRMLDRINSFNIRSYRFGRQYRWNPADVEKNAAKIKNKFRKQTHKPHANNSSLFDSNNSRIALYKKLERMPDVEYAKISALIDLISQGKIQVECIANGLWLCKLKSAATPPASAPNGSD